MKKLRIGVVSYLNAVPLWYSLQHDPDIELVPDTPARLTEMMDRGEIDVGLLPVVEALRHEHWSFFPDLGIAAEGRVDSVGLFTRKEPENIETIALTTASRTSVALTKIVLDEADAHPKYIDAAVTADNIAGRDEDAVLLIGDQCLRARMMETGRVFIDLAAEWKLLADLPFVFALWAGPAVNLTDGLHNKLRQAWRDSAAVSHDLVRYAGMDTGWGEAELAYYLDHVIIHGLDERCMKGLLEFARRAARLELVPKSAVDKVLDAMGGS